MQHETIKTIIILLVIATLGMGLTILATNKSSARKSNRTPKRVVKNITPVNPYKNYDNTDNTANKDETDTDPQKCKQEECEENDIYKIYRWVKYKNLKEHVTVLGGVKRLTGNHDGSDNTYQYTNLTARFKIKYPGVLKVYEVYERESVPVRPSEIKRMKEESPSQVKLIFNGDSIEFEHGVVFMCESNLTTPNIAGCPKAGIQIFYGVPSGDGWGGGCEPEQHKFITIKGEKYGVCDYGNDGINFIDLSHPSMDSELFIEANFNDKFTREDFLKAINTLEFIPPNAK